MQKHHVISKTRILCQLLFPTSAAVKFSQRQQDLAEANLHVASRTRIEAHPSGFASLCPANRMALDSARGRLFVCQHFRPDISEPHDRLLRL